MTHLQRHRLESVSDHSGASAPSTSSKSDSSDGSASEICDAIHEWSLDAASESQSIPSQNSSGGESSSSSSSGHRHHHHHHHHGLHNHSRHSQQQIQKQPFNGNYINEDDNELEYSKHDLISLDGGMITDFERAQVESFFSGLGTEVSLRAREALFWV